MNDLEEERNVRNLWLIFVKDFPKKFTLRKGESMGKTWFKRWEGNGWEWQRNVIFKEMKRVIAFKIGYSFQE